MCVIYDVMCQYNGAPLLLSFRGWTALFWVSIEMKLNLRIWHQSYVRWTDTRHGHHGILVSFNLIVGLQVQAILENPRKMLFMRVIPLLRSVRSHAICFGLEVRNTKHASIFWYNFHIFILTMALLAAHFQEFLQPSTEVEWVQTNVSPCDLPCGWNAIFDTKLLRVVSVPFAGLLFLFHVPFHYLTSGAPQFKSFS